MGGVQQPPQGELHHGGTHQQHHDGAVAVTVPGHQHGVDEIPNQSRHSKSRDHQCEPHHKCEQQGSGGPPVLLDDAPANVSRIGHKHRTRRERWHVLAH